MDNCVRSATTGFMKVEGSGAWRSRSIENARALSAQRYASGFLTGLGLATASNRAVLHPIQVVAAAGERVLVEERKFASGCSTPTTRRRADPPVVIEKRKAALAREVILHSAAQDGWTIAK